MDACDACGEFRELYHNESYGLAFCFYCDKWADKMYEKLPEIVDEILNEIRPTIEEILKVKTISFREK